jgi:hypothetical protein
MTRAEARRILGVHAQASEQEIKKAYRKAAMRYHPDRNPDEHARDQFIEVHEAYEVLTNPNHVSLDQAAPKARQSYKEDIRKQAEYYTQRTYGSGQSYEERYRQAREAYDQAFERKSQEIYLRFFEDYKSGWKRKFVRILSVISTLLALLFIADYYLPQKDEVVFTAFQVDYVNSYYTLEIDGRQIDVPIKVYAQFMDKNYFVHYSQTTLFRDFKEIKLYGTHGLADITPRTPVTTFPLVPLLLLFPIMSFLIERPTFNFTFFVVHINIYIVPLVIVGLLLGGMRVLRLLEQIT